jgi:hypothetical protein
MIPQLTLNVHQKVLPSCHFHALVAALQIVVFSDVSVLVLKTKLKSGNKNYANQV